jgi:hypothetical protein
MTNHIQQDEAASAPKPTNNLAGRASRVISNVAAVSSTLATQALRALPNPSAIGPKADSQATGYLSNTRLVDTDRLKNRETSEGADTNQPRERKGHNEILRKRQEESRLNRAIDLLDDAFAPTILLQDQRSSTGQRASRQKIHKILGGMSAAEL